MSAVRLDKFLAQSGERTRSEATRAIRAGQVAVNGHTVLDPAKKVQDGDAVTLQGAPVADSALQYYVLHKPAGVLTAARDSRAATVMDIVPPALRRRKVLPVGRLDKDTTGLLLLTNDGALAHALLHPKRHVWKRYIARVSGRLTQADADAFAQGLSLSDFEAKPAKLVILEAGECESLAAVEVREGKFHQVKRMFASRGHEVLSLHREAFGPLTLPGDLPPGALRHLTDAEVQMLQTAANTPTNEEG